MYTFVANLIFTKGVYDQHVIHFSGQTQIFNAYCLFTLTLPVKLFSTCVNMPVQSKINLQKTTQQDIKELIKYQIYLKNNFQCQNPP